MDNAKVQTESSDTPVKVRKSIIRKSIQRTLSTGKFETIVIQDGIEEEIEWTTLDERQKKLKNWETLLIQGFKQSHDRILDELSLSHKKAFFKNNLEDKSDYQIDLGEPESRKLDDLDALGE